MNNVNRQIKVLIDNEDWVENPLVCTFAELEEFARMYTAMRIEYNSFDAHGPVTVRTCRNIILDDKGEMVGYLVD